MVYEHLQTPQRVVQRIPHPIPSKRVRLQMHSEDGGQVEFRFTTFAVGALATCKLMRNEVQPFFDKAYNTGELETIYTSSGDTSMHKTGLETISDTLELAQCCFYGRWGSTLDEQKEYVRNVSLSTIPLRNC